jgi:hypothetical protein
MLALVEINILRKYSLHKTEIKLPESKSDKKNTVIMRRRMVGYLNEKDITNKGEIRN